VQHCVIVFLLQQKQSTDATIMTTLHHLLSRFWCMLKNAYQFKEETCSSCCLTLECVWFLKLVYFILNRYFNMGEWYAEVYVRSLAVYTTWNPKGDFFLN
jgi:hypothetical protein